MEVSKCKHYLPSTCFIYLRRSLNFSCDRNPESLSRHKDRLDYYVWLAKTAEKGKISSIFFADIYGTYETYGGSADATFRGGSWVAMMDPVVLIGAMAQATESISFAVTGSTSYLSKPPDAVNDMLLSFFPFRYRSTKPVT
jgi:alkanesulfonate monooxygenase SsuD/methylene tetrahydromethanopterin reductase-like flavin-dependent oxidoreductase (luciferase family)